MAIRSHSKMKPMCRRGNDFSEGEETLIERKPIMGDKSPKSKKRNAKQKTASKQESAAKSKAKQASHSSRDDAKDAKDGKKKK